ncbi:MAG: GNAT family N-acetyltransferase [Bacteroidetes bacterium]|nr:GNAT family N-acetyltransferase [Bacteroidota bacterium]
MSKQPVYRPVTRADSDRLQKLYREVAAFPGGIARRPDEITSSWCDQVILHSSTRGISLAIEDEAGDFLAEIHGWKPGPEAFSHVIGDVTMAVHLSAQGKGLGRLILNGFIGEIRKKFPDVCRIELAVRESNRRAQELYASVGFKREGVLEKRIVSAKGTLESDYLMALVW